MRIRIAALIVAVPVLFALDLSRPAVPDATSSEPGIAAAARPNVLIVMTDDQRATGTLQVMPATRHRIADLGTRFPGAVATTPLCCPSRSSVFTGRYAHNHGVQSNSADAPDALDESSTIQRYLHDAGYRTGIYGKFLNLWDPAIDPPFFDRWAVHGRGNDYYGGTWTVNGTVRTVDTYSTDFVDEHGVNFIRTGERDDAKPWFLVLAPLAPHPRPTPEPDYASADVGRFTSNPAVREQDRSDKPPYVRDVDVPLASAREMRRDQLRTLLSVDDLVGDVVATLRDTGELRDTLVFFLSDNGMLWGEHHLIGKSYPYTWSTSIPFLVRWPGHVEAGAVDPRLAANIDITPTILDATGIAPQLVYPMDGRSLLEPDPRDRILEEFWRIKNDVSPTWAAIRTHDFLYVESYADDASTITFREYYDLAADPWELVNLLRDGDPTNDPDVPALHAQLANDRTCAGTGCP